MDGVFSNMIISHLKIEEILSVLFTTPEGKTQTAIFGVLDRIDNKLYIILINGDTVVVPISIFTYTITKPDFDKFRLVDYGYAIQFGDYEASMSFILTHKDAVILRLRNYKNVNVPFLIKTVRLEDDIIFIPIPFVTDSVVI